MIFWPPDKYRYKRVFNCLVMGNLLLPQSLNLILGSSGLCSRVCVVRFVSSGLWRPVSGGDRNWYDSHNNFSIFKKIIQYKHEGVTLHLVCNRWIPSIIDVHWNNCKCLMRGGTLQSKNVHQTSCPDYLKFRRTWYNSLTRTPLDSRSRVFVISYLFIYIHIILRVECPAYMHVPAVVNINIPYIQ